MVELRTGSARPELPLAVVVSAGGLGSVVARRLGERNRLLLVDSNPDVLEKAAGAMAADGFDVSPCLCDITDRQSVEALAATVARAGPMRILAHVAGLSPNGADWQSIMRVNLLGPALVAQALVRLAQPGSAALFVSSTAAHIAPEPGPDLWMALGEPMAPDFIDRVAGAAGPEAMTGTRAYLLSKRALNRMVRDQASAWAAHGARIVTLSPGPIASPMGVFENRQSASKSTVLEKMPMHREGTMQEIADAVEFLTSYRASFITGTDLLIDGGMMANWP